MKSDKASVFTAPYSSVHAEVVANLFGISMGYMRAVYCVRRFRPSGLGQCLVLMKTCRDSGGIASGNVEGLRYAQKLSAIGGMKSDDLAELVQRGLVVYMRLEPGGLLWKRPGYLVNIRATHDACHMKWSGKTFARAPCGTEGLV